MPYMQEKKSTNQNAFMNPALQNGTAGALRNQARNLNYNEGQALLTPPATTGPLQRRANQDATVKPTTTTEPKTNGMPQTKTLGQDLVANMEELNKSPGLKGSSGDGEYNVGYRPGMPVLPPNTRIEQLDGGGTRLVFPPAKTPEEDEEQFRINLAYQTAQAEKNGHVSDVWEDKGRGMDSKYFGESAPKASERFSWRLKDTKLAAEALDHWLFKSGDTTTADCASALVAIQLQTLRQRVGEAQFNKMVAQSGAEFFIAPDPMKTPLKDFMSEIDLYKNDDKGTPGARPLKEGDAVYFANHPDYIKYAPDGLWSGENCIYMGLNKAGEQTFSGFGVQSRTEADMNKALVKYFNEAAAGKASIDEATLLAEGGGLQTSFNPLKPDENRSSSKGLRLDDDKVAARVAANEKKK